MTDEPTTASSSGDANPPSGGGDLELVVEGQELLVQGFVKGLFVGGPSHDWPVFNNEFGIEAERFSSALKEWVGLAEHLSHFVVAEESLELVRDALRNPRCPGLELRAVRPVLSASFDFTFAIFNEELGQQARDIFEKVPDGVAVADYQVEELRSDADKGVELYTSAHDYELKGQGSVSGSFRDTLYVHEQARRVEQIAESELRLVLGDPIAD